MKTEKPVASTTKEGSLPEEISNIFSSLIPEDVDLNQPSQAQGKRKVPKKISDKSSRHVRQGSRTNSCQNDFKAFNESDYSETSANNSSSDTERVSGPPKSKAVGVKAGRKAKRSDNVPAVGTKKLNLDSKKLSYSKRSLDSERSGALPITSNEEQQEADKPDEPETVAYSETPPSRASPLRSPLFMDRSGAPIIRVLLDPELFPPMSIPSLKCRGESNLGDEADAVWPYDHVLITDKSHVRIKPRLSHSMPSSPVQARRPKRLLKQPKARPRFKLHVDTPTATQSPAGSRQASSRMRSSALKQLKIRSFSASPTHKSLRKITRELSEILARSLHLSSSQYQVQKSTDSDEAAVLPSMDQHTSSTKRVHHPNSPTHTLEKTVYSKEEEEGRGFSKKTATEATAPTRVVTDPLKRSEGSITRGERLETTSAEVKERMRINKEGHVVLRLKMSELFSTKGFVASRLEHAVKDIMGFEVGIHLTSQLMPEQLVRELRPMAVTVDKVTGLPSNPGTYQDLVNR